MLRGLYIGFVEGGVQPFEVLLNLEFELFVGVGSETGDEFVHVFDDSGCLGHQGDCLNSNRMIICFILVCFIICPFFWGVG